MEKQEKGPSEVEANQGSAPLQDRMNDKKNRHFEVKKKKMKSGKGSNAPVGKNGKEKKKHLKGVKKSDEKEGKKKGKKIKGKKIKGKMSKRKEKLKKKKKVKEEREHNQEEDNEEEDELVVDFELIDPTDKYKDNVRILLRSTELYSNLKCTEELVSIICDQQNIGKFLCVANGPNVSGKEGFVDDPTDGKGDLSNSVDYNMVGFQTIINVNQYTEIGTLKEFLLQKVKKVNVPDYVESAKEITFLLSSNETKNIGLLIGHRILNTPITLVPLIHKNIIEDVYWSQGIEDLDESEKKFYFFDCLLFYTKVYKNEEGEIIFSNYEEEYFFQNKTHHVLYNNNNVKKFYEVVNGKNREVTYKEFITIFVVPFGKVGEALKEMQRGVTEPSLSVGSAVSGATFGRS
ncbi:conserved Plasmodium protein, unknown function [Plasmodium knowlesi strain H]|uniref:Protein BCP1 n=3 Tax=Plasmodium knowlesi TaxID=5850 RepID=A0A5K1U3P3_PLAKH|nr:protein BCP1, putative [Plasmodium knowlesi strain H]OTN65458.1 Uncharacterized protein PKNOH_S110075400 [Plasmodium knowlesi]CAA9989375.1 protein BCP1, putative [Plasmodium knowlesi strain H]SBO24959.1 conserved Plasmodium protein, unknown function [Plasmodium knowlesi strain H]SBO27897.1 conserved Plasmodium protein, unknown function [Plasmodium knowlesi strain H]VVS78849.1 protein BCP1, putative [Plasmodium knowlesi strain H]|eukprot:XP_002260102.1 hypothetical protein, conserved in Plasmodium species [Plasmodium knowlesi strain H]